jgi:hypothetical protein
MTIIKQLQKNTKFRSILKKHGIGWRRFVSYCAFGLLNYETGNKAVCMGKHNGVYDYFICFIRTKTIDMYEEQLIEVIEK